MRSFVLIFAIAAFAAVFVCNAQQPKKERTEEEKKAFKEWAEKHKKTYQSPEEEAAAMERVLAKKEKVDAHNKLFAEGKVKYQITLWEHSDKTAEERKLQFGGINFPESDYPMRSKRQTQDELLAIYYPGYYPKGPASIDWREKGLVGPVRLVLGFLGVSSCRRLCTQKQYHHNADFTAAVN